MPDRLLEPGEILAIERAATLERLIHVERLVVIDHQRDTLRDARLDGVHRREIFGERRIAEPELDRAEAAFEQLLGLVGQRLFRHQPEPAGIVGRDAARLATEQTHQRHAGSGRKRIPAGDVEARHRHADDALHADQREAFGEFAPEFGGHDALALGALLDLLEEARDRHHGAREIGPKVRAPGDSLGSLDVDQHERRLGDPAPAGAERVGHRHLDPDGGNGANRQSRKIDLVRHMASPPDLSPPAANPALGGPRWPFLKA